MSVVSRGCLDTAEEENKGETKNIKKHMFSKIYHSLFSASSVQPQALLYCTKRFPASCNSYTTTMLQDDTVVPSMRLLLQ